MRLRNKNLLLSSALLGCVAALPAYADTHTTTGTFTTANQSEWNTGSATVLNYTSPVLGPSFSASPSIGGITCVGCGVPVVPDTYWGAEASLSLSGSLGLQVSASLDSGSVNASVPFSSTINAPNQLNSSKNTSFTPTLNIGLGSSQLQVFAPTAQASVNLLASLNASGSVQICGGGCTGTSGIILNGSGSLSLLSINQGNNGAIQVLGQTVQGLSGSVDGLNYSAQGPQNTPNATGGPGGRVSTGVSSDVASLSFDADQALASALGIQLSGSKGPISWSLGDVSVSLDGLLDQSFSLDPTVSADLYVPLTGQNDFCSAAGCGAIEVPTGFQGELQVDPRYVMSAVLTNDTGLDLKPGFDVSLLSAGISGVGSIGPAYSYDQSWTTPEINLYQDSFLIGGFSTVDGRSFDVNVVPTAPEPGTLALAGIGLAALALARRRRKV
jgi:hypothetical protein